MSKKNANPPETSNSLGNLCDTLYALGEQKGKINAQLKELDTEINTIEQRVMEAMQAQETTIARGKRATVSLGEREVPNVIDWPAFIQFIIRQKRPDLLQRRIAKGSYDEMVDSGKKVPGVVVQKFPTLRVNKVSA